ncbi:molybdate ABC transporter ATP-binding protein ModF [Neptunicella sp. SCSIO 80796]|uniref:molybdate ABC transporter ATP-binding protein ModF n=1 Tax=Neptunicella plasticusilytica TaxID=3117012 RepID=UPI003A4D5519
MTQVCIHQVTAQFNRQFRLHDINWQISAGQHWAIVGANGSGKSALAALLAGAGEIVQGELELILDDTAIVSSETLKVLLDEERKKDDADILDIIPVGTTARELIFNHSTNKQADLGLYEQLVELFNFSHLLESAFTALSTGETRKLLLIRALIHQPKLLILDEPYDGLDSHTCQNLAVLLEQLSQHTTMVLVLNRFDEIADFVEHFAYMQQGTLSLQVNRQDQQQFEHLYQLLHLETTDLALPPMDNSGQRPPELAADQPLVRMQQAAVRYGEQTIFDKLDWTIQPGQHWQLSGPNGSGKTCLLNMITGDHPQCYANDIFVFGFQRGSGESIWQIKQYIGFVSNSLHLQYRVNSSVRHSIISGFYDSIGLYQTPSKQQIQIADQWLELLGLDQYANQGFQQMSFGDQRLILIARAMIKHPTLLIMDEPCLGLDDINRQRVLALIEHICTAENTTVLYVNHHAEDKIAGIDNHLDMSHYNPVR